MLSDVDRIPKNMDEEKKLYIEINDSTLTIGKFIPLTGSQNVCIGQKDLPNPPIDWEC